MADVVLIPGAAGIVAVPATPTTVLVPQASGWLAVTTVPDVIVPLTGVQSHVRLGTVTPAEAQALTRITSAVHLGTMAPNVATALSQIRSAVTFGVMGAAPSRTLTGVQSRAQLGQITPNVEVALTGLKIGVVFGRMKGPALPFDMAWTGQAYRSETIPSYLYVQYNDDDDLQAFVAAYNTLAQELITWFADVNLPVYTGPLIAGALLDWVALGLYGQARPTLPSGVNRNLGPFNTLEFNSIPFNAQETIEPTQFYATTDDVFKRIITWNFYKGDGRHFSVRWLKRRVMRFLLGANGTDPGVDQTYQVSVGFGVGNQVDIRILSGLRTVVAGPFDTLAFNSLPFNGMTTVFQQYVPLEFAPIFKAAVDGGALQLPFQFNWIVTV